MNDRAGERSTGFGRKRLTLHFRLGMIVNDNHLKLTLMATKQIIRMTKQREVILDELSKVTSHPTADEIYEMVRKKLPRISLGTIYRNLEILSECGLIRKMEIGGIQKRFDATTENHYHIRCTMCGRVEDVRGEVLDNIADRFDDLNGYKVVDHRLELMGICPSCRDDSYS